MVENSALFSGRQLGGEFPVQDMESNQGGLLQVRIDGVQLVFENRKVFSEGDRIFEIYPKNFRVSSNWRVSKSAIRKKATFLYWKNLVIFFVMVEIWNFKTMIFRSQKQQVGSAEIYVANGNLVIFLLKFSVFFVHEL